MLEHRDIVLVRDHAETSGHPVAPELGIANQASRGFTVGFARGDDPVDACLQLWVLEVSGNAERHREIGVPQVGHVHARHGYDLLDILQALGGLDQRAYLGTLVRRRHRVGHRIRAVVVVSAAEHRSAHAFGRVTGPSDELFGFFGALHHLEQKPHGADIEQAGGVGVTLSGRADQRHDAEPAA